MKRIDYSDLYYSIYNDSIDEDYKELIPYKPVFEGIKDHIYLYSHLSNNPKYDKWKSSDKYMKEIINICKRAPIEEISKVDIYVFEYIDFWKAPYVLTSLKQLNCFLNPNYMAIHNYEEYYKNFIRAFDGDFRSLVYSSNNRDRIMNLYNYRDLVRYVFDNEDMCSLYFYYQKVLILLLSYFYANNYPIEKVKEIMNKINNDFSYYNDLISMNTDELDFNMYKYIEIIIKELDNNKKLIK